MNICIIGDSHVAGFRRILQVDTLQDYDIDFFACASSRKYHMGMLVAVGDRLEAVDAGLIDYFTTNFSDYKININNYDVVLLVGLRLEFPYNLAGEHSVMVGANTFYCSRAARQQALQDLITEQSLAFALTREIRKINDKIPILIVPNPLLSSMMKTLIIPTAPGMSPVSSINGDRPFDRSMINDWYAMLDKLFSAFGARIIRQPRETIEEDIFTQFQFAKNSTTSAGVRHMEMEYWDCVKKKVFDEISNL